LDEQEQSMKFVGVGLNKTGTTTLGVCFRYWGLSHISVNREAFQMWLNGDMVSLLRIVCKFDCFEDWPWPLIYKEIDKAFPDSKYILTRRKDPKTWFTSLSKHAERTGPKGFRQHIYGYEMPHQHEIEYIQFYNNHLKSVSSYFKDRPDDFLEVCWEDGHGWKELAQFIGFKPPNIPFPHANKRPQEKVGE